MSLPHRFLFHDVRPLTLARVGRGGGTELPFGATFDLMELRLPDDEIHRLAHAAEACVIRPNTQRVIFKLRSVYLIASEQQTSIAYCFRAWVDGGCASQAHSGFWAALRYGDASLIDRRVVAWWSPGAAAVWTLERDIAHELLVGLQSYDECN